MIQRDKPTGEPKQGPAVVPPRAVRAGVYEARVVSAAIVCCPWRQSAENLDGATVRLQCRIEDEHGPADIFDAIDVSHGRRLQEIAGALGLPPDSTPAEIADKATGRSARLSAKNITPLQGKHAGISKAVVASWIPAGAETTRPARQSRLACPVSFPQTAPPSSIIDGHPRPEVG